MTPAGILSILVLASVAFSAGVFVLGAKIDHGRRNTQRNKDMADVLIRTAICSTLISWGLSVALAVVSIVTKS